MKETYRQHKLGILEEANKRGLKLRILFSLSANAYRKHSEIDFKSLDKAMPVLLKRVTEKLNSSKSSKEMDN